MKEATSFPLPVYKDEIFKIFIPFKKLIQHFQRNLNKTPVERTDFEWPCTLFVNSYASQNVF